jgi:SlyX protein
MVTGNPDNIHLDNDPAWVEVQTKIAFQEDAMLQLSDVVAAQQQDIMKLQNQMKLLVKELSAVLGDLDDSNASSSVSVDQKPPHY